MAHAVDEEFDARSPHRTRFGRGLFGPKHLLIPHHRLANPRLRCVFASEDEPDSNDVAFEDWCSHRDMNGVVDTVAA